eukprot:GHVU01021620.1.p1 GENE.GHVU01021620.1~~GHVU01021620.1.p1  ORF type:complete len:159 (-),score=9.48 GHVU01021620.1:140-616(-)
MAPSKKENKKKKTLPKRERGRQRAATESEKDHEEVEIEVGGLTAAGLGAQGRGRGTSGGVLRSVATGPEVPSRGTTTTPQVTPVTHQFGFRAGTSSGNADCADQKRDTGSGKPDVRFRRTPEGHGRFLVAPVAGQPRGGKERNNYRSRNSSGSGMHTE